MSGRCIGLLRAVNVGGRNMVKMADLRAFLADLGLGDPQTLLQSGNIVFDSARAPADLETWLEAEARTRLGIDTTFYVRTAREWQALIDRNPFTDEADANPGHLLVYALKHTVGAVEGRKLSQEIDRLKGPEQSQVAGRHLYLMYPAGIGTSKLTPVVLERALGTTGTGRNWNTVPKLQALAER